MPVCMFVCKTRDGKFYRKENQTDHYNPLLLKHLSACPLLELIDLILHLKKLKFYGKKS